MKKFYFFLVALVLGVMSASAADYYLIGGFNNWTLKDSKAKFTASGANEYVLDFQGQLTSGFKINDGTWSNDNANFGAGAGALELGVPYTYAVGGSTGNINLAAGAIDNPHIVLNTANKTLTISGQEAEVVVSYDIWGNLPNASSAWASTELVENNGVWSANNVQVTAASDFGIRELTNGAQTAWISAAATATISGNGTFSCMVEGTNFTITPGTYNLAFDPAAMTLTVTTNGDVPVYSPETLYVIGDLIGTTTHWNPSYGIALTKDGDKFTGVVDFETAFANDYGYFSLCTKLSSSSDDWSVGSRYGATAADTEISSDETLPFVSGDLSWMILPGSYNVTVDFAENTITVVKLGEVVVGAPETLYVIGDLRGDDNHWNPSYGVALTKDGDVFSGTIDIDTAFANDYGYFSFCTELSADAEDWSVGTRYGATEADVEVESGEYYDFMRGETSWKVLPGIYDITVDFGDNTIILSKKVDSVANIEMGNDAAPVYYNLQGVRVDAPANGLYIVVRGDKVAKEIVK
ncbi:MAG: hypothetical protein HDS52_03535 [Barnesiella sp.]|nr:hypothetical protein [Barnesiella sp.]